jgi:hypothetical protein
MKTSVKILFLAGALSLFTVTESTAHDVIGNQVKALSL